MKYSKYNVVIIGSGLAGLYLANKLASESKFSDGILLITKDELYSGSTSLAQGGIVSVIPEFNKVDSVESHIKDTLHAGCGLNDINTVKFVSENSYIVTQELIAMGVQFDKDANNMLNFTLEGAHSVPRILHTNGDSTGSIIERVLSDKISSNPNIDIYTYTMALEILADEDRVAHGLIVHNIKNGTFEAIYSNSIIIATGGIGQLYQNTTNPKVSTGDGIALALKVGAEVDNMEFVQFHPTGLYIKNTDVTPLVSESVRGEGGRLVNLKGEYFAKKYHPDSDLAPRDVVARAILNEMVETNSDYVNLDISQIGIDNFKLRFPTITRLCAENNVDISNCLIPVCPVQHYFMGGIKTDINSQTSVKNIYALGECSMTGLHGANRLASNSLLECAVFAHNLSEYLIKNYKDTPKKHGKKIAATIDKYSQISVNYDDIDIVEELFNKLKLTMTMNVGITRTKESLFKAKTIIENINESIDKNNNVLYKRKFELMNALLVAKSIVDFAIRRETSIGAHYRSDSSDNTSNTNISAEREENDEILAR